MTLQIEMGPVAGDELGHVVNPADEIVGGELVTRSMWERSNLELPQHCHTL
ncbi:hypothetical protein [Microvirga puerhi]|uniref:Uncharacterized protein n=1 Tax=Microvirga puerhi TaxID=2876078 RepID=A0ABS7VJ61_9HYPH|nr:hypothetical protein [Microvirga puerhi]MBZ6075294.1 hypothetical protein [Microvirga puerhi]